jgi:hypothetical protein
MHRTLILALALPLFCPSDARAGGGTGMADGPVAEIVTFHLAPGSDETAFLAAARATDAPVAAQPGFLRRVLSRDDTGLWTDHVEWADLASAEAAAQAVMAMPEFGPFAGFIDPTGMTMRHARVMWAMGD